MLKIVSGAIDRNPVTLSGGEASFSEEEKRFSDGDSMDSGFLSSTSSSGSLKGMDAGNPGNADTDTSFNSHRSPTLSIKGYQDFINRRNTTEIDSMGLNTARGKLWVGESVPDFVSRKISWAVTPKEVSTSWNLCFQKFKDLKSSKTSVSFLGQKHELLKGVVTNVRELSNGRASKQIQVTVQSDLGQPIVMTINYPFPGNRGAQVQIDFATYTIDLINLANHLKEGRLEFKLSRSIRSPQSQQRSQQPTARQQQESVRRLTQSRKSVTDPQLGRSGQPSVTSPAKPSAQDTAANRRGSMAKAVSARSKNGYSNVVPSGKPKASTHGSPSRLSPHSGAQSSVPVHRVRRSGAATPSLTPLPPNPNSNQNNLPSHRSCDRDDSSVGLDDVDCSLNESLETLPVSTTHSQEVIPGNTLQTPPPPFTLNGMPPSAEEMMTLSSPRVVKGRRSYEELPPAAQALYQVVSDGTVNVTKLWCAWILPGQIDFQTALGLCAVDRNNVLNVFKQYVLDNWYEGDVVGRLSDSRPPITREEAISELDRLRGLAIAWVAETLDAEVPQKVVFEECEIPLHFVVNSQDGTKHYVLKNLVGHLNGETGNRQYLPEQLTADLITTTNDRVSTECVQIPKNAIETAKREASIGKVVSANARQFVVRPVKHVVQFLTGGLFRAHDFSDLVKHFINLKV